MPSSRFYLFVLFIVFVAFIAYLLVMPIIYWISKKFGKGYVKYEKKFMGNKKK